MKGDYCTREGAERLKEQIEAYWAERGHDVRVNLVSGGFLASMRSARTDVRSNLINGVPTRSTGFFETNALYDVNIPQAARVEVTKGPGTALYGSDAIGGVINVMTRLPTEETTGSISIEGSSREYYRALASVSGTSALFPGRENTKMRQPIVCERKPASQYVR